MNRIFSWFYDHQVLGWTIAVVYLIVVSLTHDVVQRPALTLQRTYGVEVVHFFLIGVLIVLLALMLVLLFKRIVNHQQSRRMIWTGLLWLILATLVLKFLMVRSIESIHYFQYMILALMIGALTRNPLLAAILAACGGAFDEGWQFFQLHPRQPYFDFNDTTMNATGALLGVWLYALYRPASERAWTATRKTLTGWAGVAALIAVLFATGALTVYRQDSGIPLHRRNTPTVEKPVKFFNSNKWGNDWVRLHPFVGLGILFLIPIGSLIVPKGEDYDQ